MQGTRLQKVMAQAGVASRRKAERLITQGHVTVNGQLVTALGTTVDPAVDVVVVDGRRLSRRTSLVYVLLHKPRGYITTCDDEQGRPTVFDLLQPQPAPHISRWAFGREFRRRVIVDQRWGAGQSVAASTLSHRSDISGQDPGSHDG